MCGRYGRDIPWSVLRDLLDLVGREAAPNLEPEWDIRPTTRQPVIRAGADGLEVSPMRWGLIPFFHKGPLKAWKATCFNARAETVSTSAAFREPFRRSRCLVPASCWYEWTGGKGSKVKSRFTRKDEPEMMLAGLWDGATTADEGRVESFSVITQPAGSPLNGYHDRAPVVLPREAWRTWLDLEADVAPLLGPESVDAFHVELAA